MRIAQFILSIFLTFSALKVEAAKTIGLKILDAKMSEYSSSRVFMRIRVFNYVNDTIILKYRMLNSFIHDIFSVKFSGQHIDTMTERGYVLFQNISFDFAEPFSGFPGFDDREAGAEKRFLSINENLEQTDDSGFHIYKIAPKAYMDLNIVIAIDRLGLTYIPFKITPKQKAQLSAELALRIDYLINNTERHEWVNSGNSEELKNALITW